jgi:hypothetical protein
MMCPPEDGWSGQKRSSLILKERKVAKKREKVCKNFKRKREVGRHKMKSSTPFKGEEGLGYWCYQCVSYGSHFTPSC